MTAQRMAIRRAPRLLAQHPADRGARHQIGAEQVDLQHALEILRRRLPDRPDLAEHAGIVDQDVDAAMVRDRGIGRRLDRVDVADVELTLARPAPQFGDGLCQAVRILVPEGDTRAGLDQRTGDAATEAASTAGDDRMPAGEIIARAHQPALQAVLVRVI